MHHQTNVTDALERSPIQERLVTTMEILREVRNRSKALREPLKELKWAMSVLSQTTTASSLQLNNAIIAVGRALHEVIIEFRDLYAEMEILQAQANTMPKLILRQRYRPDEELRIELIDFSATFGTVIARPASQLSAITLILTWLIPYLQNLRGTIRRTTIWQVTTVLANDREMWSDAGDLLEDLTGIADSIFKLIYCDL